MSDSFARFQRAFDRFTDQQAADVEALRTALQCLVVTLLSGFPGREERFAVWRKAALDRLENETKLATDDEVRKRAQLSYQSAVLFFDEMEPTFGMNPSGSSHPAH
jgi:hypothetical protein